MPLQFVAMNPVEGWSSVCLVGMGEMAKRREHLQVPEVPSVFWLSILFSTPGASTILSTT